MFREQITPPVSNCDLFLGDKQQNQQNSAKEHAPKKPRVDRDVFAIVQLYRKRNV
jgi:hypothetical protein